MKIIKAPTKYSIDNNDIKLFLAGTIDNGFSKDWQSSIYEEFEEFDNLIIFNPRRKDWNSNVDPSKISQLLEEQILWELNSLEKSDYILLYIAENSKSPISLLELGIFSKSKKMIVVCDKSFYRYANVKITCDYYNIPIYDSLSEGTDKIRSILLTGPMA